MPKCFQYYYKGNCNRGDKCKFSHSEIENNSKRPENNGFNYSQKKRKNNTVDTNQNNSDTEQDKEDFCNKKSESIGEVQDTSKKKSIYEE